MIKYIIFDWGEVCTHGHLLRDFSFNLSKQTNTDKEKLEKIFRELEYPYETGKISPNQFWKEFKSRTELEISVSEIQKIFLDSYSINNEMLNYLLELKKKYKLVLFSNNYEDLFTHIKKVYKLDKYFDYTFSSSDIKFKKPEKKSYKHVLGKIKAKPNEVLFVDNKEKNIIVAKQLGLKTIMFKDINQLKEILEKV